MSVLALVASACSSDNSASGNTDSAIWPSNATELVVSSSGGGFAPPAPSGSVCPAGQATYTLTVATLNFAWEQCQTSSASGPYVQVTGERSLTRAEFDGLIAAVRGVTASTSTGCGADKATLSMSVTTPGGEQDYLDDFYACNHAGTYVSGLDDLFHASASLVTGP